MYSFFAPCSCSTIAKELKLNSYLELLIKLWKEKMSIDQKHKQNACFYVPPKSQCKHCHTCNWKGQTKPHLGKVCFFYQHCFTKKNAEVIFECDQNRLTQITALVKKITLWQAKPHPHCQEPKKACFLHSKRWI